MKKIILFAVLVVVAVSFIQISSGFADPQRPPFESTKEWSKLDDATQNAWQAAMKGNDSSRRIDCFVRVRAPFDAGDRSFLFSVGYNVRAVSGNVASGHVAAKDLPNVAALPFVDSIKIAGK